MVGEEQSRLTGGVPRANEMDVGPVGGTRFAACRSVIDPFADKALDALDGELTPRYSGGKNDGPSPDNIVSIEEDLSRQRIDALDGARDQDLCAESPGLLERTIREFLTGNSIGEPEAVLDPRRCSGLAAWRLAFDHQRSQSFRCSIHRRCESGRPAADDGSVVFN